MLVGVDGVDGVVVHGVVDDEYNIVHDHVIILQQVVDEIVAPEV